MGRELLCIENRLTRLSTLVSSLNNTVAQLSGLNNSINQIQNNIQVLQTTTSANSASISTLQSNITSLQQEISVLQSGTFQQLLVGNTATFEGPINSNITPVVIIPSGYVGVTGSITFIPVFQGPSYKKYLFIFNALSNTSQTSSVTIQVPFSNGNALPSDSYFAENFSSPSTVFFTTYYSTPGQITNGTVVTAGNVTSLSNSYINFTLNTGTVYYGIVNLEGV